MKKLFTNILTILTSNTCTAACGHCTVHSSPERTGRLDLKTITKAIDDLHNRSKLDVVVFAGGEPTLIREDLFEAIAHCDYKGIVTRVVTNASWAVTDHAARKMVRRFREAGLAELNISADDYHLPFISFENVKRAWRASKNQGFVNVAIANCSGPTSKVTPSFIRNELDEPDIDVRFDDDGTQSSSHNVHADGSTYMLSNGLVQRIGRAREVLSDSDLTYPESQASIDQGCPWALRSAALAPNGHLVACCGIEAAGNEVLDFGDVRERDTAALAESAEAQLMVQAISVVGPYRLLHLAQSLSRRSPVMVRSRYASVCEACEDLVRQPQAIAVLKQNNKMVQKEIIAKLAIQAKALQVNETSV
jgi:Radical SAM superfamily